MDSHIKHVDTSVMRIRKEEVWAQEVTLDRLRCEEMCNQLEEYRQTQGAKFIKLQEELSRQQQEWNDKINTFQEKLNFEHKKLEDEEKQLRQLGNLEETEQKDQADTTKGTISTSTIAFAETQDLSFKLLCIL
ncbi:uncharacterized protein [Amphiura filiformis]|uniref:uncharacterized protein n=1 Tax=Amphiura filiformis TaxID=82378 RepID=UPI003B213C2A